MVSRFLASSSQCWLGSLQILEQINLNPFATKKKRTSRRPRRRHRPSVPKALQAIRVSCGFTVLIHVIVLACASRAGLRHTLGMNPAHVRVPTLHRSPARVAHAQQQDWLQHRTHQLASHGPAACVRGIYKLRKRRHGVCIGVPPTRGRNRLEQNGCEAVCGVGRRADAVDLVLSG